MTKPYWWAGAYRDPVPDRPNAFSEEQKDKLKLVIPPAVDKEKIVVPAPSPRFDAVEGDRQRDEGKAQAAAHRHGLLGMVRRGVTSVAEKRDTRCVTADDAQEYLEALGYKATVLGNSAGSIFKGKEWEFTGQWINSTRVTNHSRAIRVWRLK